jgi:hypothetical protein
MHAKMLAYTYHVSTTTFNSVPCNLLIPLHSTMADSDWAPHYIDRPVDHADDCASLRDEQGARPNFLALQPH